MKMKRTCIGIDIGRSAVKIVATSGKFERAEITFPSAFSPAVRLTDDQEAERAATDTVEVNKKLYFVGETALLQGRDDMIAGLSDDWGFSNQHAALLLAGMKKLESQGVPGVQMALIVVGLPARLYAHQKATYANEIAKHAGRAEIKVVPQPLGPYYTMLLDSKGQQSPSFDADDASWGIIEVGQYTTDYALVERGRVIEHAFGSCDGMHIAATNLQKEILGMHDIQVSVSDATDMLATPTLKNFGERIDVSKEVRTAVEPVAQIIADKANQLFGERARKMDGIRVAGGGAPLVIEVLRKKWANTSLAENSRFSVAEGFCRFAVGLEQFRNEQGG
jgi:plasmid segregation protein ParM